MAQDKILPNIKELFQMDTTFVLAALAWIFFRADSIGQAFSYIEHVFSKSLIAIPKGANAKLILPLLLILVSVEWMQRDKQHGLDFSNRNIPSFLRIIIYYALMIMILQFGAGQQTFIYFQF